MFNEYCDIVTVEELCEMLRIGRNKAYNLLRSGQIRAFRCGKTWVISKEAVSEFVMRCGSLHVKSKF